MDRTPTIRPVTFPQSCAWAAPLHGDFISRDGAAYKMRTIQSAETCRARGSQDFFRG